MFARACLLNLVCGEKTGGLVASGNSISVDLGAAFPTEALRSVLSTTHIFNRNEATAVSKEQHRTNAAER